MIVAWSHAVKSHGLRAQPLSCPQNVNRARLARGLPLNTIVNVQCATSSGSESSSR